MCCGSGYDETTDSILPPSHTHTLSLSSSFLSAALILGSFFRSFSPLFYEGGFRRDSSDVSLMIKASEPSTDRRRAMAAPDTRTHITLSFLLLAAKPSRATQMLVIVS